MAKLTEVAEFIDSVLRLDKDTPVKGFDPDTNEIGPSNEQAQVLANRTLWLKEKIETVLLEYVISVNGKSGKLTLDYSDVGADKAGAAVQEVADHEANVDPHPGYYNEMRGDARYLKQVLANQPNGWLQLDAKGKLPATVADVLKTRYVVVDTEAERLALTEHDDLTICAQLNGAGNADDQLFYLNGGEDPADKANWILGSSAVLAGVSSIFGRTGMIVAENGDYNADQITETANRVFLSPAEKQAFAQKQDQLQSGTNIKTLHGKSLLGSADIKLDNNDVGADAKGTAVAEVSAHEAKADPHSQYLNQTRGDSRYVKQDTANKPLGYVQLDAAGKLPTTLIDVLKARYVIVQDDTARYALPTHDNLTIAMQLNGPTDDDDQLWYLNGGDDPTVPTNWIKGQQAVAIGVTSIFGRTGMIQAASGDYNADQITETATRTFITPTEKATYAGKEDKGAGTAAVAAHEAKADPHANYLNQSRGDARYVQSTESNKANGYLKLDSSNKIPSSYIDVLQARHVIVQNDAERLALPAYNNLTICAQLNGPGDDDDRLYYLNGGLDPAVDANWHKGQSAILQGVPSAFGRTGAIVAQTGDYNADQITETATRKFVTPAEKASWSAKQVELVSSINIKTIYGTSILGGGDITFTPTQIGAAEKLHVHTTSDITDYVQKTQQLVTASMEPGTGISLGLNPINGKTVISSAVPQGEEGSNYVVATRTNATANQVHSFAIQNQSAFNLDAYALKEELGTKGLTVMQGNFAAGQIGNYLITDQVQFNGSAVVYRGEAYTFAQLNSLYVSSFRKDATRFTVMSLSPTIIPVMYDYVVNGYTANASSTVGGNYIAWRAFDRANNNGIGDCWASNGAPTPAAPQWLSITLPSPVLIAGYGFMNRWAGENGFPTKWTLQGKLGAGSWEDIGGPMSNLDATYAKVKNFPVSPSKAYDSYRLYITEANGNFNFVVVQEFYLYVNGNKMMFLDDDGTTGYGISEGALVPYPNVTPAIIDANGFSSAVDITPALFNGKAINRIASSSPGGATLAAYPPGQIVIQKELTNASLWDKINSATVTATQSGGTVRMAVSRDLVSWKVYQGGTWVDIGTLNADQTSADKLTAQGMSPTVINALTATQWTELFASNNNSLDNIAFAYAIDSGAQGTGVAAVDRLLLNADGVSSWKLQTPAEVEIRWRADNVSFKTITAGNYKLAYQLP